MSNSPSSPPPKNWPVIILFLAAIGVPSAAGLTFARTITQHPWQALGLALLYEGGVLIVSLLTKVWQQLEGTWVKRIADWIDINVQGMLSGYWRHYCCYLTYEHRDFDVKGLSTQGIYTLNLEQVFVELSIDPMAPHQTSANPLLRIPEELRTGEHALWDYLTSKTLQEKHLVLIGAPGSGKTTLLKHLALTLVSRNKHHRPFKIPYTVPFLLFLRNFVTILKEKPSSSLVDAIQEQLSKWGRPVPSGWIERRLEKGQCLLLVDGLDEVADADQRQQMANWVQQQMTAYGKNRFIITSRPFGYRSNPLSGVVVLQVHPFTPEQVKQFVQRWYLANEIMSRQQDDPGVRMKAEEGAEDLVRRLRNTPSLFALAVNPLLLTMIATVHRYRSMLPGKRVELYAEICEVFLGKRQQARGVAIELRPAQSIAILQPLAYEMMLRGVRNIESAEAQAIINRPLQLVSQQMRPEAFLQMIEQMSGLLLEQEGGVYSFAHLTFQEYLASVYIRENKLEEALKIHVEESWWHETIRLYSAQADATTIIAACLSGSRPSVPALTLAIDCQKEALQVQPVVEKQLNTLLDQGIEDPDPERRHVVANALLTRRLREMVHVKDEIYRDTSLITCAEYQVFLDEQQDHGNFYKPDHWKEAHFPPGQAHTPILGVRPSDAIAFCDWLTARESGVWRYRLPRSSECEGENDGSLPVTKIGYWVDEGKSFVWQKEISPPSQGMTQDAQNRTQTINFDSIRALDLARAVDFDLSYYADDEDDEDDDRARVLARALDRASVLALGLDRASARTLGLANTRALYLGCALARTCALGLNRASALDFARDLDLVPGHDPNLAPGRDLGSDPNLARALYLARSLARSLARIFSYLINQPRDKHFINTVPLALLIVNLYIRAIALANALPTFPTNSARPPVWKQIFHLRSGKNNEKGQMRSSLDLGLDIYEALLKLQMRIEGKIPACEGILIVKEPGAGSRKLLWKREKSWEGN